LVIGCGSELRGDDAVGLRVAEQLARRTHRDLDVQTVHQLTPELADSLAEARVVVFIDAAPGEAEPCMRPVAPAAYAPALAHAAGRGWLVALTQALHGRCAPCWLLAVPATDFEIGAELSAGARAAMHAALDLIGPLLEDRADVPWCRLSDPSH